MRGHYTMQRPTVNLHKLLPAAAVIYYLGGLQSRLAQYLILQIQCKFCSSSYKLKRLTILAPHIFIIKIFDLLPSTSTYFLIFKRHYAIIFYKYTELPFNTTRKYILFTTSSCMCLILSYSLSLTQGAKMRKKCKFFFV